MLEAAEDHNQTRWLRTFFSSLNMVKMVIIPREWSKEKILRHPKYCVRNPPRTGPVGSPTYAAAAVIMFKMNKLLE